MFQIRKKKEVTFKTKVDKFWRWFSKNAARFKDVIDDDRCGDLLDETSKAVNALGDFGWCYGPGKEEGRHAFTLTPEGIRDRQYLTQYWISRCPDIPDWCLSFHEFFDLAHKRKDTGSGLDGLLYSSWSMAPVEFLRMLYIFYHSLLLGQPPYSTFNQSRIIFPAKGKEEGDFSSAFCRPPGRTRPSRSRCPAPGRPGPGTPRRCGRSRR